MLVDTHAHIASEPFKDDLDAVLGRAVEAGVGAVVCVGDTLDSSRDSIALAAREPSVWATAGVHPHHAHEAPEGWVSRLRELLAQPRVVAVGEVGLDFHYDFAPRDVQEEVFRRQIRIAVELGLPLVIHSREAGEEVLRILREEQGHRAGGVLHCFWGDRRTAMEALELGFYLGVGGPVTFKSSQELRDVLAGLPLDRLVVETDSPYLAPVPHRGKRNEPAFVVESARALAQLKGVSLEELADVTTENARRLFRLY